MGGWANELATAGSDYMRSLIIDVRLILVKPC